ncbi:TetR/AcrR family transcriptional regulator [Nocardioides sp. Bht2]|uniref:TetR/AcrR family transcriptional regulator n=1 Tax=Nocardioides sp. Bht2 TaxID=3392297 RepID=UPI0039B48864
MADPERGERILSVAGGLFLTRGVAGTTIRQIAQAMNMSSGTIYYYYPSKESIASAILHRFLDELAEAYAKLEATGSGLAPDLMIREIVRTSIEVASRHPHATEIYGKEVTAQSSLPNYELFLAKAAASQAQWRRVITAGVVAGVLRADVNAEHAREVMSHLTWMTVAWNRPRLVAEHREIADQLASLLLDGFSVR